MSCHDRRHKTVACLGSLLPQMSGEDSVFLLDDGSTDGTANAVVGLGDPRVHVVYGDGTLFWSKSMRKAWETAVAERQDWDGYLWLNDDTELKPNAIAKMLAADGGERIVVGELENAKGEIVYGTRPGGLFTGNCVLVPRKVYEQIGMICGDYSHAWADSDYAMQAKRAAIGNVSAGVVGSAEGHPNRPPLRGLGVGERWRMLFDPKGWNIHDLWLYRRRNWNILAAALSCLHLGVHVLIGER